MVALPSSSHVSLDICDKAKHILQPELHPLWVQSDGALAEVIQSRLTKSLSIKIDAMAVRGGDSLRDDACLQRVIVEPNSIKRTLWDLISIIVLSIDIVMVPLSAFDIPETPAMQWTSTSCTIFWSFDIVASCITGFHIKGMIEMRPMMVLKHYMRNWFPFDIALVLSDWFLMIASSDQAEAVGLFRLGKAFRFGRMARGLRLFRMMKMPPLLDDMSDYFRTDGLLATFQVLRALVTIGVVNHFLACGWYAVGKLDTPSWIDKLDTAGRDLAFRYVSALHWSLTQFTPASMEIFPMSFAERVYAICVLFLALVVFSSFVSSITNAMNHLRLLNEASSKQRANLRRYIHENKLSVELGNRIGAFARHLRLNTRSRVHEHEVEAFKVLPESLRLQLHFEVYVPILSVHPLFFSCVEIFEPFVLELCHCALSERSLMPSQELFNHDDEAKAMYFAISGSLEYYPGSTDIRTATVNSTEWCCEVALWLTWFHQGQLAALSHSELAVLDASMFRKCVSRTPPLLDICRTYALSFQERASNLNEDETLDVFDAHDASLEMAHKAFGSLSDEQRDVTSSKHSWRTWHSFSLIRISTPPLRFRHKSNTQ
jgi:hypothetical protein